MKITLDAWVLFGFFAQFIFFLRFAVQWWASEKAKRSVVPMNFWYLSIIGSVLILIYALKRGDIVFITAQFLALFIYARNISLRRNETDASDRQEPIL